MRLFFLVLLVVAVSPVTAAHAEARAPILVLGDSLSAAFHIAPESGWVVLLGKRLREHPQYPQTVVNASISGETSAGGLARLPALLAAHKPGVVVVELGSNDGLRGLPVDEVRANIRRIVTACRAVGAAVVLVGVELPVNYGPQYREALRSMYRDVAAEFNAAFVPFLLDHVALEPRLMQEDGLHPLAAAEPLVLDNVWPVLEPALRAAH